MIAPAPLMIMSPPRSFSTIACAMLGQHPELYGFPELNLFECGTVAELLTIERSSSHRDVVPTYTAGLVRALGIVSGTADSTDAINGALEWLHGHGDWTMRQLLDYLLQQVYPKRGIAKSPRATLSPPSLQRAVTMYPDSVFL